MLEMAPLWAEVARSIIAGQSVMLKTRSTAAGAPGYDHPIGSAVGSGADCGGWLDCG
jgi:hypothetical protein